MLTLLGAVKRSVKAAFFGAPFRNEYFQIIQKQVEKNDC